MLHELLESRARPARRRAGTAASVVLHAAVIGAAVAATGRATERLAEAPRRDVIFVAPRPEPAPPAPARRGSAGGGPAGAAPTVPNAPALPALPSLDPPAVDVAVEGPARDLVSPGDFAGGGLAAGPAAGADAGLGTGGALAESLVDEPVVPDARNPPPRYPEALRAAGRGGRVVARFVVDTVGRVEAGSVEFVAPGDPLLEAAVREALARARFRPARAGGRRVRQLAERAFAFAPAGA